MTWSIVARDAATGAYGVAVSTCAFAVGARVPYGGGRIGAMLSDRDMHICVPHNRTARIQEVHLLVIHCLCDAIDVSLLGEE